VLWWFVGKGLEVLVAYIKAKFEPRKT